MQKTLRKFWEDTKESVSRAQNSDLRKFGIIFSVILVSIFYVLIPWLKHKPGSPFLLLIASMLFFLALAFPVLLYPLYFCATFLGGALGAVNNRIILGCIYFLIFTPLAFVARLIQKDILLKKRIEPGLSTYRVVRENKDMICNKEKGF